MLDSIKQWFGSYQLTTHTLAGIFGTLVLLFAAVTPFRDLVMKYYAMTPSWFHDLATALLGIYAFYHAAKKDSTSTQ